MKRIIYQNETGGIAVIIPAESVALALKDVPEGVSYEIVDEADIPADRFFRNAWVMGDCCVDLDLDKCKALGHAIRRTKRAQEFAPLDEVSAKQIPGMDTAAAEAARQMVRDKYAVIQDAIDEAETPDEIKEALAAGLLDDIYTLGAE